ncbi:DUF5658 family protein [Niallia sp. 01092]|uniref:DUF5658 family protein n=1 Tax=unclassified Niallia TaxID=2837522 RepID=UPI003FCFDCE3
MKILFILLSLFNLADGLFTCIGLHLHFISESNPLMESIWNISPFLFLFCKITLSVLLFCISMLFLTRHQKTWTIFLFVPLSLYLCIMLLHFAWIVTAVSF